MATEPGTDSIASRSLSRWSLVISIVLAATLLYWASRGVQWSQVWRTIAGAQPAYLWLAAGLTTFSLFLRGLRWRILLNAEMNLGVGPVFRANAVGYLANNFLPARAGEALRSLIISRAGGVTYTFVLTTALSERLMDVVAVVLAAALALLGMKAKPQWMRDVSRGMLVVAAAGVLAVMILPHSEGLIGKILKRLPLPERMRNPLLKIAAQVLLGLRAFHDWGRLAGFSVLTAIIWSADGLGVMMGARALGLTIAFPAAMLLLTAMGLGSALPSTPGYFGIYQFAAVLVLVPFGISRDQAIAYSVLAQAVSYVVVTAMGLPALYLSRKGMPTPQVVR